MKYNRFYIDIMIINWWILYSRIWIYQELIDIEKLNELEENHEIIEIFQIFDNIEIEKE